MSAVVVRCPNCDNALMTMLKDDTRVWIGFVGIRTLEVSPLAAVHGYAGDFCLATGLGEHAAGTLVRVSVSARDRARVVLHFSNHDEVVTDACVLLCGSVGELLLLDLGYTGPLVTRPLLAARERARRHGDLVPAGDGTARSEMERMQRT